MHRIFFPFIVSALLFGCAHRVVEVAPGPAPEPQVYSAVGYGFESRFKNYPEPQRRLLAIRAAKLDAYRSLAEEFHGTRIRGLTTVKDMAVENDSYRAYVDAVVRGARLTGVAPKGEGVYEAEVELRLNTPMLACLRAPTVDCVDPYAGRTTTRYVRYPEVYYVSP